MYTHDEGITIQKNEWVDKMIVQTIRAIPMPPLQEDVLAYTFTLSALANLRPSQISIDDFVMQRLRMAGFPVIEREAKLFDDHYVFDGAHAGVISILESFSEIRYEWRPA